MDAAIARSTPRNRTFKGHQDRPPHDRCLAGSSTRGDGKSKGTDRGAAQQRERAGTGSRPGQRSGSGPLRTFGVGEPRKSLAWAERPASLFHFRTRDGIEVDIVVEDDDCNVAGIEVKASSSVNASHFKGLRFLQARLGDRFTTGVVLYTGGKALPFGDRLTALPLQSLWG